MIAALLSFFIVLIIICMLAGIFLWAVQKFAPDLYPPARYGVGALALIAILMALVKLVNSGVLPGF